MPYRNIFITNSSKLSTKNNQLVVNNGEEYTFPIEDIRSIIIENQHCTISSYLISKLSEYGVCVIFCNEKHLPTSTLISTNSFSTPRDRIQLQLDASLPLKKRLWQKIVISKIQNQAKCLSLLGNIENEKLYTIAGSVNSGDSTNREGYAANIYFKALFGNDFKRDNESTVNASLNFGYSVLRSFIARVISSYGLEAVFGIHHNNKYNAFNLADDLIEPFRPVVDLYVATNIDQTTEFSTFQKAELSRLLNAVILSGKDKHSVAFAVERLVQSLVQSFEEKGENLKLPCLLKTDYFDYD